MNCETYFAFEGVFSDHRFVKAKIRTTTTIYYDWSLLNNKHIRDKYALILRNKFDALQKTETYTPNDEYENYVNAHLEVAAKYTPTKQRAKPRVPWETLAIRKKRADLKTASKCNWKNPTYINTQKLKKAQNEVTNQNEQNTCKIRSIR